MTIRGFLIYLIGINLVFFILFILFGGEHSIVNFEIAFFSSLFITLGSYYGAKRKIQNKIEEAEKTNDRDIIDTIEDRFDLYSEDVVLESEEEIKEFIKSEKKRYQLNSLKNLKHSGSFFSLYRLGGYIFLIFGFFYLVNNNIFDVSIYLISLGIVPIALLVSTLLLKEK